ncbi:MAG: hypothetical protein U9N53_12175 [Bacteroidota bacterium]|nr:hypothetical protein [Bacteroidota bacterium]
MKILLLCISLALSIYSFGQKEFAPIGATWYYSKIENFAMEEGYVKIVSERDTTIEGKLSKVLSQTYFNISGDSIIRDNFLVHQNEDTVFYWLDNAFRAIYNFSLTAGDTMEIYSSEVLCPQNESHFGYIKVDSILNFTINDVVLKKVFTAPIAGSVYMYPGPFLELIGGVNGIFPIDTGCSADIFPDIGKLRCYSDPVIGKYQVSIDTPCDTLILITNVRLVEDSHELVVSYNPIHKTIDIIFQNFELYDNMFVNIYDLMGRSILNKRIVGQTTQMDLSGFINNVYIIQIVQNKELIYNEKIYKT